MKVIWAVLCQSSAVDGESNNLSLFNIIEEVTITAPPPQEGREIGQLGALPMVSELVILWSRSDQSVGEHGLGRLRIMLPEGKEPDDPTYKPQVTPFDVNMTQHLRLRHRLRFMGLPIVGEGIYLFVIDGKSQDGDWEKMFEVPLRVVIQNPESA